MCTSRAKVGHYVRGDGIIQMIGIFYAGGTSARQQIGHQRWIVAGFRRDDTVYSSDVDET